MNTNDFTDLKLFITGPTYIRPEVRQAGCLPEFGHRDSEAVKRFGSIFTNLATLAGLPEDSDYKVAVINGSGTCAMETAVRSLAGPDDTILSVSVGAFGDLFHKLAVLNGKRTTELHYEPGQAMDLASLERALDEVQPSLVLLTHNETSTGVTNDVAAAVALVHSRGALAAVDGVSIFGGAPIDLPTMQPDIYLTATQKSIGLPAGFGLAFAGPKAVAKAETVPNKGWITDLTAHLGRAAKLQTLTTPNTALANQMAVQLNYIINEEGMDKRFARHIAMRDRVHEFVNNLDGFELFAPEGYRSPTVTCVQVPEPLKTVQLKAIKETMRAKGYLFDPGYGKLNTAMEDAGKQPVFRIGHMGDTSMAMLDAFLATLGPVLKVASAG